MDLQLKGKRAVVSGSTAGIGYAIAAALAREGANVVVNGRTATRVDKAVADDYFKGHTVANDIATGADLYERARRGGDPGAVSSWASGIVMVSAFRATWRRPRSI